MSRKSKHRGQANNNWPLNVRIFAAKNQWHYFTKPAIKLQVMRVANKAIAFITRNFTRWPK